jgi:hypothetical protein
MPPLDHYIPLLRRIQDYQTKIAHLHPLLNRLHPVAIVENGVCHVFDLVAGAYAHTAQAELPIPVPQGVRASFPLDFYANRPACVVTGEVFDSLDGYVTIFHEFVHCTQWESGEQDLRQSLSIAQQAQAAGDMMWEINYPFPYQDPGFQAGYTAALNALKEGRRESIHSLRLELKSVLPQPQWEYLVWQEWKEGLARWVENLLQRHWELSINTGGFPPPFSRVSFYAGGALLIDYLEAAHPGLTLDLPALFRTVQG